MNKQLKKKVELKLVHSMEGILSGINSTASAGTKKKVKQAGKMVAKKFLKIMEANKMVLNGKLNHLPVKKSSKKQVMPKRDSNGKFAKKKK